MHECTIIVALAGAEQITAAFETGALCAINPQSGVIMMDIDAQGFSVTPLAARLRANTQGLKRFDIAERSVIKTSQPRCQVQGSFRDRNMHAASWAGSLTEVDLA